MNLPISVPCHRCKPVLTWTFNIIFVFTYYTFLPMPATAMVSWKLSGYWEDKKENEYLLLFKNV